MKSLLASKKIIFVMASVLLAGCTHGSQMVPVATEPDLVSMRIAQAAEKASKALDTIASIELERGPEMPETPDYSNAPEELKELITVKWTGPIEQMLLALSTRAGMKISRVGARPAVPVMVSVDTYQQPLIAVLRDVGLQAGSRADVSVDSEKGLVEIRYASIGRK